MNYKTPFLITSFCFIWGFFFTLMIGLFLKGFIFLHSPVFNIDLVITLLLNGFMVYGFVTIAYNLVTSDK